MDRFNKLKRDYPSPLESKLIKTIPKDRTCQMGGWKALSRAHWALIHGQFMY
jgi:hypothetical protein